MDGVEPADLLRGAIGSTISKSHSYATQGVGNGTFIGSSMRCDCADRSMSLAESLMPLSWVTYDWVVPNGKSQIVVNRFTGNATFLNIYVRV